MIFDCTGMMVIVSSPSGAGKTTLVKLLSKRNKSFEISISNTTRVPRRDEIEGKDYYFINEEKFNDLIKTKSFYEHARVFNNLYGTLKDPVIKHLSHGKDVLFDIDWNGSKQMKRLKLKNKLISIFILPPNIKTLRDRLSNRDMKDKLILKERMNQFKNDVLHWKEYDYIVINNDLEKCYQAIMSIIDCEKKGKKFLFDQNKIKEKISELIS
ncbi:MAG: guanylate kinase [Candidatus Pelagibacter sp.]|jgi:guanylate kinase|nr:guanylate kinase [Candidatus Pelagibacter sp.]|tara:strand:+ start:1745 stop:2380 length:636 start_codon:yes stop_codon:yes gene_type:complete